MLRDIATIIAINPLPVLPKNNNRNNGSIIIIYNVILVSTGCSSKYLSGMTPDKKYCKYQWKLQLNI